ncbi:MAG: DNA cytosine methyltransferase [Christensenellaceae bacterium]
MKKIYNIVELFSGIGSQARALKNIGININVQATCEWDMHAFIAYDAMHESYENLPEVEKMTKEQILEILKKYTLSNNGKEAMNYATLHSYSEKVPNDAFSNKRTHNLVDISTVTGDRCRTIRIY